MEYLIRDPALKNEIGIDPSDLYDDSCVELWTNKIYQLTEWRVYRQTNIDSKNILKNFHRMDQNLCTTLPIMLEIQYLWMDGTLPNIVWDDQIPSIQRCTYNKFLFVDVTQTKFRSRLPFHIDEFLMHVENLAKEVKDALETNWLVTVASKLSQFVSYLSQEQSTNLMNEDSQVAADLHQFSGTNNDIEGHSIGNTSMASSQFEKITDRKARKTLRGRAQTEGLLSKKSVSNFSGKGGGMTSSDGRISASKKPLNKAENVIDCATVLMSRQLRGMCEASLLALSSLFENLSLPYSAAYCIFIINVRIRRVSTKEMTTDFSDPLEVCLQPDMNDIIHSMNSSVNMIVNASRGYERPEQVSTLKSTFGGKNNYMIRDLQTHSQHKRMNEASVALSDSIVTDVKSRIKEKIVEFFKAPAALLNKFSVLEKLFSGAQCDAVLKTVRDCIGTDDIIGNLEKLGNISREIETMIEAIKTKIPDVSHFPMFEVRSIELKDLLIRQCRFLHSQVMDAVVEENRNLMLNMGEKYTTIMQTMTKDITDSSELKALQDYVNKSASILLELNDQYQNTCFERVRFLLNHKHRFARDDIQLLNTTLNWPIQIQGVLRRAFENMSARKRELEELLEEDQRRLENDCGDLFKRVELIAENGSPMDFRKIMDYSKIFCGKDSLLA